MKILEVVEKQGKEGKPYWNIVVEGGESKYANWFDLPAPVVGMTEFEMVRGKAYTDKKGVQRNYWNAKPDRLASLEKRVRSLEDIVNRLTGDIPRPIPDDMQGDPMGIPDDDIPM